MSAASPSLLSSSQKHAHNLGRAPWAELPHTEHSVLRWRCVCLTAGWAAGSRARRSLRMRGVRRQEKVSRLQSGRRWPTFPSWTLCLCRCLCPCTRTCVMTRTTRSAMGTHGATAITHTTMYATIITTTTAAMQATTRRDTFENDVSDQRVLRASDYVVCSQRCGDRCTLRTRREDLACTF